MSKKGQQLVSASMNRSDASPGPRPEAQLGVDAVDVGVE